MTAASGYSAFCRHSVRAGGLWRRVSPLPKVYFTLGFLVLVVSFGRYDWRGCVVFALFPFIVAKTGGLSAGRLFRRTLPALPFVLCAGIANLFADRGLVEVLSNVEIPGGVVSLVVLVAKTLAAVGMALTLSAFTSVTEISGAMTSLRAPCILVLQFQLVCRYLAVLAEEARNVVNACLLRSPGRGAVPLRHWGALVGRLFLRSVERANAVYSAMQCRLFHAGRPLPGAAKGSLAEWTAAALIFGLFCGLRWAL